MKGYELSVKDSEPSFLPTQVSVTVGDGEEEIQGEIQGGRFGGRVTGVT